MLKFFVTNLIYFAQIYPYKLGLALKFERLSKLFSSKPRKYFSNQSIFNPKAPRWAQWSLLSCPKRKSKTLRVE